MKLKCTGVIDPTDKKQKPFFVKGKIYEGEKLYGDVFVAGEQPRKSGGNKWQAVNAHPAGWVIVGVAKFEEIAE